MDLITRAIPATSGSRPRISVSDGQGTSGEYAWDYRSGWGERQQHVAAARRFLAELKGWQDAVVEITADRDDNSVGFRLRAGRP